MLARSTVPSGLAFLVVILGVSLSATAEGSYVDDLPSGLSNYRTGGWQWPYNDGTGAGNVTAGPDNWTVYFDATYNAMTYAIRQTPEMYDFTITIDFVIPTRDFTPGDRLSFRLRWNNTTYPDQSGCGDCAFPMADSGITVDFFLGENQLIMAELGDLQTTSRDFDFTIGRAHEVRLQMSGQLGRVYVDGALALEATNLTSPSGLFGIVAYRVDLIVDLVRIDVIRATGGPSNPALPPGTPGSTGPSGISFSSPWIVAPAAFFAGVATVLAATRIRRRLGRNPKRP